jgi:hypothetical protein
MAVDLSKHYDNLFRHKWDEMGGVISGTCQMNCDEYFSHKA